MKFVQVLSYVGGCLFLHLSVFFFSVVLFCFEGFDCDASGPYLV